MPRAARRHRSTLVRRQGQTGARRLDSDKDYVRAELASALKRDIAVIPILVDGAVLPAEDSLSDDLKPLARRHALELRHTRFAADADAIVHALETMVPRRRMSWPLVGAGIAAVVVVAAIAVLWPKLRAKPAVPPPVAVAAQPAPVTRRQFRRLPRNPLRQNPPRRRRKRLRHRREFRATAAVAPEHQARRDDEQCRLQGLDLPCWRNCRSAACQAACRADTHCAAWTYTHPAAAGAPAHCSLKAVIPAQLPDSCCISAVERLPPPELRDAARSRRHDRRAARY